MDAPIPIPSTPPYRTTQQASWDDTDIDRDSTAYSAYNNAQSEYAKMLGLKEA